MDLVTIIKIFLFGITLSMDAFAVSVTDGLIYRDLNKKKVLSIALTFGFLQALMPLIGYYIVEWISVYVGEQNGARAGEILSTWVTYIAFVLLFIIGAKMLVGAIVDFGKKEAEKSTKLYSYKEVFIMGIATAIDALATGVAFHAGISNNLTIFLHVFIIMICTFSISLVGLFLASKISTLLKGKFEITGVIGGAILIALAFWVLF